jgi:hypothetical protein
MIPTPINPTIPKGTSMTTTKNQTLWQDLQGFVACPKHMGISASTLLQHNPKARMIRTDLTIWERLTRAEVTDWLGFLSEQNESRIGCDTCRHEATDQ